MTIGTMSKFHRMSTEEVYTVGFVPSYLLPDKRPNALGPFLEPLVADLENSFIEGSVSFFTHSQLTACMSNETEPGMTFITQNNYYNVEQGPHTKKGKLNICKT